MQTVYKYLLGLDDFSVIKLSSTNLNIRDKAPLLGGIASVLMDTLYFQTHEARCKEAQRIAIIRAKDAKVAFTA